MDDQRNMNTTVSWIALAVGIIAITFSIIAFNRAGTDIEEIVERETSDIVEETEQAVEEAEENLDQTLQEADQAVDRTVYIARLEAIRARAAAGATAEEVADDIAEVRTDIEADLENADVAVRDEWNAFLQDMEAAEDNIRAGTVDALTVLDNWITQLRQDVQVQEEEPNTPY